MDPVSVKNADSGTTRADRSCFRPTNGAGTARCGKKGDTDMALTGEWLDAMRPEFAKPYYKELYKFVANEYRTQTVYPPKDKIFHAFEMTPPSKVRVVIIGQDPYHGYGQAMGLCFSVPDNMPAPPSLKNIFKEIEDDLGVRMSGRPNLENWARQGVLLLNAILTVRSGEAASHSGIGWQRFTDAVIRYISDNLDGVVFLLWGSFARSKKELIDTSKHYVLEAAHPSPLARGAFFGCRHFSRTNEILVSENKTPINWQL